MFRKKILKFVDESDNWRVSYSVEKFHGNREAAEFSITYIRDEQIPQEIYYSFDYPSQQGLNIDRNATFEGELKLAGHECNDCAGAQEGDEIAAIIKYDGKTENFNLKHDN